MSKGLDNWLVELNGSTGLGKNGCLSVCKQIGYIVERDISVGWHAICISYLQKDLNVSFEGR